MRSYLEALEGEDPIAAYNDLRLAATLPDWLRWIARKFLDKRRAFLLGCMRKFVVVLLGFQTKFSIPLVF